MTRSIERPINYSHILPLPSEAISPGDEMLVTNLEILWIIIRQQPQKGIDLQAKLIERFFESIEDRQVSWLESYDRRWGKTRAILVKERAIQLCQREDYSLFEVDNNRKIALEFRGWIEEARRN